MFGAVSHDHPTDAGPLPAVLDHDGNLFHDGPAPTRAPPAEGLRVPEKRRGFAVEIDGGGDPLVCEDVRGFREALVAALDPRAPAPPRIGLVAPEGAGCAWLDRWAEDSERVRRTVTVRRRFDGREIKVIATISSYGRGTETSLSVESVSLDDAPPAPWILRSGVHPKTDVEAALALYEGDLETLEP
jgi:hypothetical protein